MSSTLALLTYSLVLLVVSFSFWLFVQFDFLGFAENLFVWSRVNLAFVVLFENDHGVEERASRR